MPAARQGQKGRDAVGREEEDAPTFELADVDALVIAHRVHRGLVEGEDDVAHRHAQHLAAPRKVA